MSELGNQSKTAVLEIWPDANSWSRGPANPGDCTWVIFEKRHGRDNRVIGLGWTEEEAWRNALPKTAALNDSQSQSNSGGK